MVSENFAPPKANLKLRPCSSQSQYVRGGVGFNEVVSLGSLGNWWHGEVCGGVEIEDSGEPLGTPAWRYRQRGSGVIVAAAGHPFSELGEQPAYRAVS